MIPGTMLFVNHTWYGNEENTGRVIQIPKSDIVLFLGNTDEDVKISVKYTFLVRGQKIYVWQNCDKDFRSFVRNHMLVLD